MLLYLKLFLLGAFIYVTYLTLPLQVFKEWILYPIGAGSLVGIIVFKIGIRMGWIKKD